jgi:tetratricopeptide (TPR) repeat protein
MGRYEESLKLHQEVLILRKRHLPANHPRLAASLNNLGSLYQRLGRFEEAREMLEESLEIRSRVLPDPHPLLALSYNNLATLYMAQNQWGEAVRALKRAIKMHRDLGDGEHPDMAKSMTNLAIVLSKLGDESAAEMQAGALDIMRKHLPPDHPQLGTALHNTAHHQFSAGDVAKAIETVNEARVIFENAFGPKHRTVAYCYHSLATFYANTGQKKQAIKNLQHALEIRKGIYPGAHPETAASHHVMAWLALEFGDVEMARRHAKSAVEMRRRFNTCSDLIDSMMVQLRVEFQAPNPNGDLIKAEIGTLFRQFECIWQHRNRIKEWCSLLAPQFFEDEKVNPLEPHSSNNHQTQEPAAN